MAINSPFRLFELYSSFETQSRDWLGGIIARGVSGQLSSAQQWFLRKVWEELRICVRHTESISRAPGGPKRGPVIEGTSGVRKSRAEDPTRGKRKSGEFRYIYYYIERDGQIFLLMVFNKNEQDNLTKKQKKTLSNLIRGLREGNEQ
jgi:hypothetical protein